MPEGRMQTPSFQGRKECILKNLQASQLGLHWLQVFVERFMNLQDNKAVVTRPSLIFETVLPPHILQCVCILRKFDPEALWRFKNNQVTSMFQSLHDTKLENIKTSLPTTFLLRQECKIYIHTIVGILITRKLVQVS